MCYLPYTADMDLPAPPVLYTQSLKRHRVNIRVTLRDEIYSNPNNKKDCFIKTDDTHCGEYGDLRVLRLILINTPFINIQVF